MGFSERATFTFEYVPWQTVLVKHIHEWIWIELFHVPYTCFFPYAVKHKRCANHRRNTCGVRYCLRAYLFVTFRVVTVVIDKDSFFFTIFNTCDVSANAGHTAITFSKGAW